MWLAAGVYKEYREVISQENVAAPGQNIFITLEAFQRRLGLNDKEFSEMISDIKQSILYRVRLAKAPAAYKGSRRYKLLGEEWVFLAIEHLTLQ